MATFWSCAQIDIVQYGFSSFAGLQANKKENYSLVSSPFNLKNWQLHFRETVSKCCCVHIFTLNTNKIESFNAYGVFTVWIPGFFQLACSTAGLFISLATWAGEMRLPQSAWPSQLLEILQHSPRWQVKQTWGLIVTQPFLLCLFAWLLWQHLQWELYSKYQHFYFRKRTVTVLYALT